MFFKLLEKIAYTCSLSPPFIYFSAFTCCDLASAPISPLIVFWLEQGIVLEQKDQCQGVSSSKFSSSSKFIW